jgi:UDP-N-acetylmuramoyl-L-alanyl-D-glutamate--2,6-diaminopimelate ligase
MRLRELARALGSNLSNDRVVTGIAQDNRRVRPGFIFVARQGDKVDGHSFAEDAVRRGAIALVGERALTSLAGVPYLKVDNAKAAAAKLAAAFHAHPSRALFTIGVTGTDGKTTTSCLLHQLLSSRYKTGLLSTAAIKLGETELELEGHFTTPEAPEVQQLLARFRDEGCSHAVIESSSHGFAQHRLDEVTYNLGVWTNLSHEHLDFHGSFEAYREAKLTLMRRAELSILNRDDPSYEVFAAAAKGVISYGSSHESDWQLSRLEARLGRLEFAVRQAAQSYALSLPMVGHYNAHNAVAALAAARAAGIPAEQLIEPLSTFAGVPGRMQVVQSKPFSVIVDFAHTPPALEKALLALQPLTEGSLIVVIGAAGERDPGKRSLLGKVAREQADVAVFTEEDSRSENIHAILVEMAQGAMAAGGKATQSYWCIADRREAIQLAIKMAQPGDTVLLAGKGHERTLERATETLAWDEVAEARRALAQR